MLKKYLKKIRTRSRSFQNFNQYHLNVIKGLVSRLIKVISQILKFNSKGI